MITPVTAVQRTRLGTTNAVEILLMGKKYDVSFIMKEISRVLFSGYYRITRACVFLFCPNFRLLHGQRSKSKATN